MPAQVQEVRRVLLWRATTIPTRLAQAALIGGLTFVATGSTMVAVWFAATAATALLDAHLCRLSLDRGETVAFSPLVGGGLGLSSAVYASIALVLIRDAGVVGLGEAALVICALLLNAAMMSRGAQPAATILAGPPSLILISMPLLARLFGHPVSLRDTIPLTIGALAYIVFVARIAAAFGAESNAMRQVLEEKEAGERSFKILFDHNPLPMLVVDAANQRILNANAATVEAFGWRREELLSSPVTDFLSPEDRPEAAARLTVLQPSDEPTPYTIVDADGRQREILPYIRPTMYEGVPALLAAVVDTTERKEAMRAIEHARDVAEAANQAKSEFLATVSHEIRTPLNGVLGMAQAMARDSLSAIQGERLEVISRSGETLLAILNDILDLSKIEAGKLELESSEFVLDELVLGTHATFTAVAQSKGISFNLAMSEAARGLYRGDPVRVRQVLHNLVSNALKFTLEGEIRVSITRTLGIIRIEVWDTGVGIPPDRIGRLFDKFVQADSSTTRRFGGTGLGLAICAELAKAMGGRIDVESQEGVGTTFTVELPLERLGDSSGDRRPAEDAVENELAAGRPLRVLAAEDNPVNQLVLKTLLAQLDLWPVIVDNGAAAVASWEAEEWDLVLMDVQMPVMDGPTAAKTIRAREAELGRRRTPIIALTANAMKHQVDEYLAAGMDGLISKPINISELFGAMSAAASGAEAAADQPENSSKRRSKGRRRRR